MSDDAITCLRLLYLQTVGIPARCANQAAFFAEIMGWPIERVIRGLEEAIANDMATKE